MPILIIRDTFIFSKKYTTLEESFSVNKACIGIKHSKKKINLIVLALSVKIYQYLYWTVHPIFSLS